MIERFDHIAIAVKSINKSVTFFVKNFGGKIVSEKTIGDEGTFSYVSVELGGIQIELIQPEGKDGFLKRFLENGGSMIHHLTFEVDDIEGTVKSLRHRGIKIVGEAETADGWKVAFVHPKSALGVLIQIYQRVRKKN